MTPLQAEMLSNSLALVSTSIILERIADDDQLDLVSQAALAKELRTAFRKTLDNAHLVEKTPRRSQRPAEAQEPKK